MDMEYKIVPVETIPEHYAKGRSRYVPLLEEFMASGHSLVMVEFEWPEEFTNGQAQGVVVGIRNAIKSMKLPIRVSYRDGEVYLQHLNILKMPTDINVA